VPAIPQNEADAKGEKFNPLIVIAVARIFYCSIREKALDYGEGWVILADTNVSRGFGEGLQP
jgi:hypothetical protein